jgi:hypothetical protein
VEPLPGLGCHAERQRVEVGVIGCGPVKARVRAAVIVKIEVAADRCASLGYAVVGLEINLQSIFSVCSVLSFLFTSLTLAFAIHTSNYFLPALMSLRPVSCQDFDGDGEPSLVDTLN